MTDILIGAADLYNWADVRPWVVSARRSGFKGDIYLICYRIDQDIRDNAVKYGVELYEVDHTPYSTPIQHMQQGSPTQSHNLRFYHAWELLTRLENEYRFTFMTDVRDVIFQKNPVTWMQDNFFKKFVAAPEHITFGHEPWNKDNLIKGFGQITYDLNNADGWTAFNVGTLAGKTSAMRDLFHEIFTMTEGRYYPSDQSSYNILLRRKPGDALVTVARDAWAAQLGTTQDPTKSYLWDHCEYRPEINEAGIVHYAGEPFTIVHQWDRVPELKSIIPDRYKE